LDAPIAPHPADPDAIPRLAPAHDVPRFHRAYDQILAAYRHDRVDAPPLLIGDVNYWITGEDPALIPDDYFDDGAFGSMQAFQETKIDAHLARYEDIYLPFVFPWYGTGVVPSAFGCSILFQRGEEPAVEGPVIRTPEEVRRLAPPDPTRDGLMPRVLRSIDHLRANSQWPVSFTDDQGPFNIALNLVGLETIMLWMYDHPTVVHELMDLCTTVLIDWVALQKRHAGQPLDSGAYPHAIRLPDGFGGVWISDDDSTIVSPALYREFVVPYNGRVFEAFGGGTLHYCGNAGHQLENFLETDGLTGLNVWCMGEFEQVFRAQEVLGERVALMVCDYTPVEIEAYFRDLLAGLRPSGTILATYPSATSALRYHAHRTDTVIRDVGATGVEAMATIERLLAERRARRD
jgi:uroporphyrinogen-III decarboxylase